MISTGSKTPRVLVLGSGTSTGVPLIGCRCEVCASRDPRDCRLRSSVYITCGGFAALIDVSPDFRQQALRHELPRVDAILLTHPHADHVFGLDDIRRYNTLQQVQGDLWRGLAKAVRAVKKESQSQPARSRCGQSMNTSSAFWA